ncbi:MAG: rhodanese-like domain-containing protein [Pseudomonadota bacterium]
MAIAHRTFSPRLLEARDPDVMQGLSDPLIVHVAAPEAFAAAHLPGAICMPPAALVSGAPPAPGVLPEPAELAARLAAIGYRPERDILIYDDEGGGWAGRFAWTLDVIGHERWWVLDGGLHAWANAGRELVGGGAAPEPAAPVELRYDERLRISGDELLSRHAALCVWDARSYAEHIGERSGSARAGRIPGSHHCDWLELMDRERDLRLREDLPALLAERGIDPSQTVIVHCQTHHRSGLAYLVGRLLDYPDVRAYDGSWADWGNRQDTPIDTGRIESP